VKVEKTLEDRTQEQGRTLEELLPDSLRNLLNRTGLMENLRGALERQAESTIAANTRFFENEAQVPRQAYSMGMQAIMQAKRVLLIASGADKAEAIRNSFFGPVTPQVPASILQLHRDVIVIADEAALADCPAEA
jgi:6-phosphogluconolactonase/glucosamine-6-phosphate isomerase/deaminase